VRVRVRAHVHVRVHVRAHVRLHKTAHVNREYLDPPTPPALSRQISDLMSNTPLNANSPKKKGKQQGMEVTKERGGGGGVNIC